MLIWPLALILGGVLGVIQATSEGWKAGDVVGLVVCVVVLVTFSLLYKKWRNKSSL